MKDFVFDPRVMIVGPFAACPKCGQREYGTLTVSGHSVTRRCRECWHTATERLPSLKKHVIYLDQLVLSEMAKSLDPVWRGTKSERDPFWIDLFDKVERLAKLQLAVFPESPLHQRESVALLPYYGVLRRLYEHLSAEVRFEHPSHVHIAQLGRAFRQYVGLEPRNGKLNRDDAIDGKVDEWLDNIAIRVRMEGLEPKQDAVRQEREESAKALAELHEMWSKQKRTFKDYFAIERRGSADAWWRLYVAFETTRQRYLSGDESLLDQLVNARVEPLFIADLIAWFSRERGMEYLEAASAVHAFLFDEIALAVPANEISALMMASIAFRARNGKRRPPSAGMFNDMSVISAYLPYCDAMFVDNECQNILAEGPIRRRLPSRTRIFSRRNGDQLMGYLEDIEATAGEGHARLVMSVYGEKQFKPWREVLAHEREAEAKRAAERQEEDHAG